MQSLKRIQDQQAKTEQNLQQIDQDESKGELNGQYTKSSKVQYPFYIYISCKKLCDEYNIPKQVFITLFNHLSRREPNSVRYLIDIPLKVKIQFFISNWEEKVSVTPLLKYMSKIWKKHSGNYHIDVQSLCDLQRDYKPFDILRELYLLQHQGTLGYSVNYDDNYFVLEIDEQFNKTIGDKYQIKEIGRQLMDQLNRVEHEQIQKLRAFYQISQMIGLLKESNQKGIMNQYIDKYFDCSDMKQFGRIIKSGYKIQDKGHQGTEDELEGEDMNMYLPILEMKKSVQENIRNDIRALYEEEEEFPPKSLHLKHIFLGVWSNWMKNGGDQRFIDYKGIYKEYKYEEVIKVIDDEVDRLKVKRELKQKLKKVEEQMDQRW